MVQKTLCMDSVQTGGLHYDVHSMYGWWEAVATKPAVRQVTGERSFVTSRSTFIGGNKEHEKKAATMPYRIIEHFLV